MNTKTILERLVRGGYTASILHHSDGSVVVHAAHRSGYTVRAYGRSELEAAIGVWNRLGFQPKLRVVGATPSRAVVVEPASPTDPPRRTGSGSAWLRGSMWMLLRG